MLCLPGKARSSQDLAQGKVTAQGPGLTDKYVEKFAGDSNYSGSNGTASVKGQQVFADCAFRRMAWMANDGPRGRKFDPANFNTARSSGGQPQETLTR